MKVSVVIPTFNAEPWITRQLDMLLSQTVKTEILVIDSGSTDHTVSCVNAFRRYVRLLQIPHNSFDHGGTRDFALRQSTGEYVLFYTQDAIPTDQYCVEKLLSVFSSPDIAAVFGRQIACSDAPEYERLTRQFNYPDQTRIWREADIPSYGIKSFFFSNACSAYRRDIYLAVGGFDTPIVSNEDMMMAAKLLHAGYALAYIPDASVYHSHHYTLREELQRNVRIGRVMEQYRERLILADTDTEGWRMLHFVSGKLASQRQYGELLAFYSHVVVRFMGNRVGKIMNRWRWI